MHEHSRTTRPTALDGETAVLVFPPENAGPSVLDQPSDTACVVSEGRHRHWYTVAVRLRDEAGFDDLQPEGDEFDDVHPFHAHGYDVLSDTALVEQLESRGVRRLVLCGGRTNHEVASTARSALTRGYEVVVVADTMLAGRTRTRDGVCPPPQDVHALTLATLDRLGATVTSVRGVVTGSYEPLVSEYLTALYTDAVGEADFVQVSPLPTPSLHPTAAALVVVNVREQYPAAEFGDRNNDQAELQVERLVDAWRARDRLVLHTAHPPRFLPDDPVLQGSTVRPTTDEPTVEAATADAFARTELDDVLQSHGVEQLVFVGVPLQEAVAGSARTALERGYDVLIVEDATAGYDFVGDEGLEVAGTEAHWIEATSLAALGASLIETEELCEQLED